MHRGTASLFVCALLTSVTPLTAQQSGTAPAQPQASQTPCLTAAPRRQFDFWVGSWDVFPWAAPATAAQQLGTNDITVIEQGCALLESWRDMNGVTGRSLNWFDRNLQTWRQLWIDQNGGTLDYTSATVREGEMQFLGFTLDRQRRRVEQRLTFTRHHADTLRQLFETSLDSGRTWTPGFDGRYIRRKP